MDVRTLKGRSSGPVLDESARVAAFESSGRRWFALGAILLAIMGVAVWTVRRDPLAISALFFAIAAILRVVPTIIDARRRLLDGPTRRLR